MVGSCCIPSCRQKFEKQSKDPRCPFEHRISFFRLPYGDKDLLQKWLDAMTRDEEEEIRFYWGAKVCSKHFEENDFYPGYANGRRHLKDGTVPHIFTQRESMPRTSGHRLPVPDAASVIAAVLRPADFRLVQKPIDETSSSISVVMVDAKAGLGDGSPPSADTAVGAEKDEAEVRASVDLNTMKFDHAYTHCQPKVTNRVEREVSVDTNKACCDDPAQAQSGGEEGGAAAGPVLAYGELITEDRVNEEISMDPDSTCCDEPAQVLNVDETSPPALPRCNVQVVASSVGEDLDLDLDAIMTDITDSDLLIGCNQDVAILPDNDLLEEVSKTDKLPLELLDPPGQIAPITVHSEGAHCSNGEQSPASDGQPKQLLQLEKGIEQMSHTVEWYRQQANDAKKEKYKLERTVELLKQKCLKLKKWQFSIENFRHSPKDVNFYTGLLNYAAFKDLFQCLAADRVRAEGSTLNLKHLSDRNELFLLLVRLRLGLFERDLAFRFHLSRSATSRICLTWVRYIYQNLWRLRDRICRNVSVLAHSAMELVDDCNSGSTYSNSEQQEELSHTGKVVKSVSHNRATIFVCPPMDMELTREIIQAYDCQEWSYSDGRKSGSADVKVVDMLCEMGLPLNMAQLLGHHNVSEGSVPKVGDIVSLRAEVESAVPEIRNYRIFYQPFPRSLLSVATKMLAICVVLAKFSKTSGE